MQRKMKETSMGREGEKERERERGIHARKARCPFMAGKFKQDIFWGSRSGSRYSHQ